MQDFLGVCSSEVTEGDDAVDFGDLVAGVELVVLGGEGGRHVAFTDLAVGPEDGLDEELGAATSADFGEVGADVPSPSVDFVAADAAGGFGVGKLSTCGVAGGFDEGLELLHVSFVVFRGDLVRHFPGLGKGRLKRFATLPGEAKGLVNTGEMGLVERFLFDELGKLGSTTGALDEGGEDRRDLLGLGEVGDELIVGEDGRFGGVRGGEESDGLGVEG